MLSSSKSSFECALWYLSPVHHHEACKRRIYYYIGPSCDATTQSPDLRGLYIVGRQGIASISAGCCNDMSLDLVFVCRCLAVH